MLFASAPYYTHVFGTMGETLDTAGQTEFFAWFHLEQTEQRAEAPGKLVRFRPSGEKFRELCCLDALTGEPPAAPLVALELVVEREFLDGPSGIFAQDLVKSFLLAALPDACREVLEDFLREMNVPGGPGATPGYRVFRGQQSEWKTETGWSRLVMANAAVEGEPSLVVNLRANPTAPNANLIETS